MNPILPLITSPLLILLVSCGSTVQSDVTRFHKLPIKGNGESFSVRPTNENRSGIEFSTYASRVAGHLQQYGWRQSSSGKADYIVTLGYRMGGSSTRTGSTPTYGQTGGGTTYHNGSVNSYSNYGSSYGSYSGTSYTPATYGQVGSTPYSVTVHDRFCNIRIKSRNGKSVFEGRANSTGRSSEISVVLPAMIDSIFTDFPGESGKAKRIQKPTE
jgi:hypothetical protein